MNATPRRMELLMIVKDLDLIQRLMKARIDPTTRQPAPLTARALSRELGWSSHTYAVRIMNGDVRTVSPDTASKIAYLLGVPVDLIFMPKLSGNAGDSVKEKVA